MEYVVDVTADQFVPDVSPVVLPRDLCHLNDKGRFAPEGVPVYQIGKVYAPERSELVDSEVSDLYRHLLNQVLKKRPPPPANK